MGIDTDTVQVRLYSCREACAVGAGDNTKMAQEVGKAIVGPAYLLHWLQAQLDTTLQNK